MAAATKRVSFSRIVAAGVVLGAGGFGILRATNAEPIPVVPPPISVAEPRPDPNALPPLVALPTAPAPIAVPPALPTPALPVALPSAPEPVAPVLPAPMLPVALPSPALPTPDPLPVVPVLPKPAEVVQPAQPVAPVLPVVPEQPANPEKNLRTTPAPLNLIPAEPVVPKPLVPEALPVVGEVPAPPRKIGNEILVPPMPVFSNETKTPSPFTITPPLLAPGDAPMLSITKLTLSTTLGVALALAPTSAIRAEDPPKPMQPDVKAVEEALKKEIKDLKEELKKTKELFASIDEMVLGRKDGKVIVPADAGLMERMNKMEKSIKEIDAKLVTLNETLSKRTVGSSPTEGNKLAAGLGKVKVVNEFATKISIVVNGTSYPIDPSQAKEIEVPMGNFSYMLVAEGSVKTNSTIKEGETVTLRIR